MFDDRIDEAARRLTEGGPHTTGPAFRARVLARLDERPVGTWPRARLLAPVAAAAAIVVLAMMTMTNVRLKPDATTDIRLKPDATTDIRLKPDGTTDIRLKPDATTDIRLKPDATTDIRLTPRDATKAASRAGPLSRPPGRSATADTRVVSSEGAPPALEIAPVVVETIEIRPPHFEELPLAAPLVVQEIDIAPLSATDAAQ